MQGPSIFRRLAGGVLLGLFLFVLVAIYGFLHAGEYLVSEDPLERANAVVVLSGGLPERALAAAAIYRSGYAHSVWLTQPLQPSAAMEDLKLPYAGEEAYSRMVLIGQGVPPDNIRVLRPKITNTEEELRAVAAVLQTESAPSVLVVTSKAHTRRVRTIWGRVAAPHQRIIVRAATEDYFDPAHWWRTSNDALSVVREYLGILNAWAGLPLHHSP